MGGFYFQATPKMIREQRQMLVGFGRAVAKATVFALENPQAAVALVLRQYPHLAATGKSREENIDSISKGLKRRMEAWPPMRPGYRWGQIDPQFLVDEVEFLGLRDKIKDVTPFFTNELIDEINRFDAEAIKRQARDYKY